MTIGSFCIIKNEAGWIRQHLEAWLPFLDQMVFFDGNSNDGTLEVLENYKALDPNRHRLTIVKNQDPKNLREDYQRISNDAVRAVHCDYAMFLHPDMFPQNPEVLHSLDESVHAHTVNIDSFAGEPGGDIKLVAGRTNRWKSIYRRQNPDLGVHYYGFYGAANEDCYFTALTGDAHDFYHDKFDNYPYPVGDSKLNILHFSDVRPKSRRIDRMHKCLLNLGYPDNAETKVTAMIHPRVTLEDGKFIGCDFKFEEPSPKLKKIIQQATCDQAIRH